MILTPQPQDQSYQEKWREHLRTVRPGDQNHGLPNIAIDVLINSEDAHVEASITIAGKTFHYQQQKTLETAIAKRLQDVGLIEITHYFGSSLMGPDGRPVGDQGCQFEFTPFGIKVAQQFMGAE